MYPFKFQATASGCMLPRASAARTMISRVRSVIATFAVQSRQHKGEAGELKRAVVQGFPPPVDHCTLLTGWSGKPDGNA